MGLSSNILWHQTNYNNLRKILKDRKILCSYGMEDMTLFLGQKLAFPMVSMCDLPFSEMSSYQGKYGDYAIGLTRNWGVHHKFNPVWYCDAQSMAADALRNGFKNLTDDQAKDILLLINILSHVKLVEGELTRHNYKTYRFYDEREVRFVPSLLYMMNAGHAPILNESDYDAYKANNGGASTLNFGVDFDWSDIKYLIVKEDKHIQVFRKLLTNLGCPLEMVHIFSSTQVKDDFIGSDHNVALPIYTFDEEDVKEAIKKAIKFYQSLAK